MVFLLSLCMFLWKYTPYDIIDTTEKCFVNFVILLLQRVIIQIEKMFLDF